MEVADASQRQLERSPEALRQDGDALAQAFAAHRYVPVAEIDVLYSTAARIPSDAAQRSWHGSMFSPPRNCRLTAQRGKAPRSLWGRESSERGQNGHSRDSRRQKRQLSYLPAQFCHPFA